MSPAALPFWAFGLPAAEDGEVGVVDAREDLRRAVLGGVVDDDHAALLELEPEQALDAVADRHLLVHRRDQEDPGVAGAPSVGTGGGVRGGARAPRTKRIAFQTNIADDHRQADEEAAPPRAPPNPRRAGRPPLIGYSRRGSRPGSALRRGSPTIDSEGGVELARGELEAGGFGDRRAAVAGPELGRRVAAEQDVLERGDDPLGGVAVP